MNTLSDSFLACRICAQAEGISQRSIDWIIAIVGYFNEFLGNLNIEAITADDLRRFIIALQQRQAFSPIIASQNRKIGHCHQRA